MLHGLLLLLGLLVAAEPWIDLLLPLDLTCWGPA